MDAPADTSKRLQKKIRLMKDVRAGEYDFIAKVDITSLYPACTRNISYSQLPENASELIGEYAGGVRHGTH